MLEFALAPGLWAAYDTQQQSLYQVWEGDVLFEGAAYDYRHGPQPVSQGAWYLRNTQGSQWFIEADGRNFRRRFTTSGMNTAQAGRRLPCGLR